MATAADPSYLDVQAAIGITKHNGGYPATEQLLTMCHARRARDVLYVGSGIGVGPVHLARHYAQRVTALDIDPAMLEWTARRARRDGVSDAITTVQGDVLDLHLPDGRFDLVVVESVIAFVQDKERAISECARVTRPQGWVGMNETVWLGERPPLEVAARGDVLGTWLPTRAEWQERWDRSGLEDRAFEVHPLELGAEARSRIDWIGWRWLLPAWGRALRLVARDPAVRDALRTQLSYPPGLASLMGYALSAGRRA
jgi:SAM-dependent methyltransferase